MFNPCGSGYSALFKLILLLIVLGTVNLIKVTMIGTSKWMNALQSPACNVNDVPKYKGQERRMELSIQHSTDDVNPTYRNGHRNRPIINISLMNDHEPTGKKGRNRDVVLCTVLIFLALLTLFQHTQNVPGGINNRQFNPLRQPAMKAETACVRRTAIQYMLGLATPVSNDSPGINESSTRNSAVCQQDTSKESEAGTEGPNGTLLPKWMHVFPRKMDFFFQQISVWVAPVTTFLPNVISNDTHYFDHLGCRLTSMSLLPGSCPLPRYRAAKAGFHYDPRANRDAVLCHRCGAALPLFPRPPSPSDPDSALSPLDFHQTTSPNCSLMPAPQGPEANSIPGLDPSAAASSPLTPPSSEAEASGEDNRRDMWEDSEGIPGSVDIPGGAQGPTNPQPSVTTGYVLALPGRADDQSSPSHSHDDFKDDFTGRRQLSQAVYPQLSTTQARLDLSQTVYPQFSTEQARLATFTGWPLGEVFPPSMVARLGFYYAGYADCLRCFFCGVGLKAWDETDDLVEQHRKWRPQCPFLLVTCGRNHPQNHPNGTHSSGNSTSGHSSGRTGEPAQGGSGGVHGPSDVNVSTVQQQLLSMGFTLEDISRTEAALRRAGEAPTLANMLDNISS